jgi:hypothetical protein
MRDPGGSRAYWESVRNPEYDQAMRAGFHQAAQESAAAEQGAQPAAPAAPAGDGGGDA